MFKKTTVFHFLEGSLVVNSSEIKNNLFRFFFFFEWVYIYRKIGLAVLLGKVMPSFQTKKTSSIVQNRRFGSHFIPNGQRYERAAPHTKITLIISKWGKRVYARAMFFLGAFTTTPFPKNGVNTPI